MDCKKCPIGGILISGIAPDDSLESIRKVCNECASEDKLIETLKKLKERIKNETE